MIEIKQKKFCCGCNACVQKCPKHCISMDEDNKGFLYPKVDTGKCVDCGICEKVCPMHKDANSRTPIQCYAVRNRDESVVYNSSSGGVFTLFAEQTIKEGGIVFGARWNNKWEVEHGCTENIEGIKSFQGSKYVQSKINDSYIKVESFLKSGRKVLFSGTPCQISGLRSYLKRDYDNLFTIDLVCHGVPSPGLFRWYLSEQLQKVALKGAKKNSVLLRPIHSIPKRNALESVNVVEIKGISFRNKAKGWKKFSFALDLAKATAAGEKNSVLLSYTLDEDTFLKGFLADMYLRPSCMDCPFRELKSGSDITICDFWGVEEVIPDYDDDKGCTAVMINTPNGGDLFNLLSDIQCVSCNFNDIVRNNASVISNRKHTFKEFKFWNLPHIYSFEERVNKSFRLTFVDKVIYKLTSILKLNSF